jgi:hypothetical protein
VNFDTNVVGLNALSSNGATGIAYNKAKKTCTLVCHMYSHNDNGTVTQVSASQSDFKIGKGIKR